MVPQTPVRKFKAGAISCALWRNEVVFNDRSVPMLKATVERRYRDTDGTWKSSPSFSRNDIPLVVYCLQLAFDAMIKQDDSAAEAENVAV